MNQLPRVTTTELARRRPCWSDERIRAVTNWYRRIEWTALEVLSLDEVPAADRLWVVLHKDFLPRAVLRRFAVEVAADAMRAAKWTDPRSWAALDAALTFERGDLTDVGAAWSAATAAWSAATAAWSAATATATAADAAADAAATDAATTAAWSAADAADAAWSATAAAAWSAATAAAAAADVAQIKMLRQITLRWLDGEDLLAGGPWVRP